MFWILVSLFLLGVISLPPSPMFFSELAGFSSMVTVAKTSHHMLVMLGAISLILGLLAVIFYKFVEIYQAMKYEGKTQKKEVYSSELFALMIFAVALIGLLLPPVTTYLKGIIG